MLTTRISQSDVPALTPSPKSDVLFQVLRGVFGQGNRRINPKALDESTRTPVYHSGLTVRVKFVCHTDTFTFPGIDTPVKSVTVERTFHPVNPDGTWNDADLNAYNNCSRAAATLGQSFGLQSRKTNGVWSPENTQIAFDSFQNFCTNHGFSLSPKQEPYWSKDEDGRKYFTNTRNSGTTAQPNTNAPITDPNLNIDWATDIIDA